MRVFINAALYCCFIRFVEWIRKLVCIGKNNQFVHFISFAVMTLIYGACLINKGHVFKYWGIRTQCQLLFPRQLKLLLWFCSYVPDGECRQQCLTAIFVWENSLCTYSKEWRKCYTMLSRLGRTNVRKEKSGIRYSDG